MWMAKVYYVDTAVPSDKRKCSRNKTHTAFDRSRTFKMDRLMKLEDSYTEIYIDILLPEIYDVMEE